MARTTVGMSGKTVSPPRSDGCVLNVDFENYLDTCIGPLNAGIRWLGDPFSTVNHGREAILNNSIYAYAGNRCGWTFTDSTEQISRIRLQRRYNAPVLSGDTVIEFVYRPQRSGTIDFDGMVIWSSSSYLGGSVAIRLFGHGTASSGLYTVHVQDATGIVAGAVTGLPQNQWQRFIIHRKKAAGTVDLWIGSPGLETLCGSYRDLRPSGNVGRVELGDNSESTVHGSGYWDDVRVGKVLAAGGQLAPPEASPVIGQKTPVIHYPISVTNERQLFVDDTVIQSMSGLARTLHPVQKYAGNPIMVADRPWETPALCSLPWSAVCYIPEINKYRVWYLIWGVQMGLPSYEAMAESVDGLNWIKPNLGIVNYNGSTANNIVRQGREFSVNFDPVDPDPARRYKTIIRGGGGFLAATSSDGLNWNVGPTVLDQAYDATSTHWDPVGQKWIASCKIFYDNKRVRGYAESSDYLNWTDTSFMLTVDSQDHPADQVYYMSIFRYESVYIGMIKIYHVHTDRTEVQLAFSRDAKYWLRPDRTNFIPNGSKVSDWDYGNLDCYGQSVRMGDELWFHYAGRKELHDQFPQHGAMGLGTLRVDGFRSVDAGNMEGVLITRPLLLKGHFLFINAEAAGGEVTIEMLEEDSDTPIPPFTRKSCRPLTTGSVHQVVQWNGKSNFTWPTRPVRLRFSLRKAKLYSFWTEGYLRAERQGTTYRDNFYARVKLEL